MVQYIDDFLTYLKDIKNASPNTISAYHNDLKKFKLFMEKLELSNLTQISETILNSYILNLENQGFSNASVSRNIASIKSFMLFLLKEGVISKDPSERLKPPKTVKKPPRTINVEQINQLLDKPDLSVKKGIRDKAMLELLYATGMKVSELVSIKISDINLERGYISCGKKRERNIPFGDLAKRSIQNYLEIRQDEFDKKNSCYLFLNYSGDKLSRQGFWKILKEYANSLGFENINPNTIRHSFASHMMENGADITSVQELMGYTDIESAQLYLPRQYSNSREVYLNTHPRA